MEEILASIRRIIADDQDRVLPARFGAAPGRPLAAYVDPAPAEDDEEPEAAEPVPELRAAPRAPVAAPAAEEAGSPAPEPVRLDAGRPDPAAEAAPVPADDPAEPEPEPPAMGPSETLVSAPADAAAGQAFQRLAATVRPRPALTMEEHVTEMLRPMLRAWLDENLPPLVERLVQAEIERISRGR
ncbi:MAG TPA: DUF2497 domain-containing protein [Microvirga sp.]|jgi:hypothetical protein|nr:DUF2497 domain-containing protein [Microvirga sp.]